MNLLALIFAFDAGQRPRTFRRTSFSLYDPITRLPSIMDDYQVVDSLEPGGMCVAINIIRKRSTGKLYVEKHVSHDDQRGPARVEAEIAALRQIGQHGRYCNLNTMVDFARERDGYHIILQYCRLGNLAQAIDRRRRAGGRAQESAVWHVLVSLSKALLFLHGGPFYAGQQDPNWNTICHLDIKPENIYLDDCGDESYPRVVLGDFGGAVSNWDVIRGRADIRAAPAWTPGWESPEMIDGREYGTKTDAWQVGAVVQTMCLQLTSPDLEVLAGNIPCGRRYSPGLNSIVIELTHANLYRRRNAEELLGRAQHGLRMAMLRGD